MATKKTQASKAAAPKKAATKAKKAPAKKAAPKKRAAPKAKAKPEVTAPTAAPAFKTKHVTLKSDGTSVNLQFNDEKLWEEAKAMLDAASSASPGFRTETPIKKLKASNRTWSFFFVQGYEVK